MEQFELVQKSLTRDADLHGQYEAWRARRDDFNARLYKRDPATIKEAWQRYYFKGEMPNDAPAPKDHVNKRRMNAPEAGPVGRVADRLVNAKALCHKPPFDFGAGPDGPVSRSAGVAQW